MSSSPWLNRVVRLGLATGVRSTVPLAGIALAQQAGSMTVPEWGPLKLLQRREVAALIALASLSEIVADATLPLPRRTWLPVLSWRVAMGALAGAIVAADEHKQIALGAGTGGLSAGWGSFAGYGGRMLLQRFGVPSYLAGLLGSAEAVSLTVSGVLPEKSAVA